MILSDLELKKYVEKYKMIEPFEDTRLVKLDKKISWGCSSYGYDFRLSDEFLVPKKNYQIILDPKNF
ncbi:MAG: hypothetical protein N2Z64_05710, partial [Dictyoglomus thermophilum]|nr:hypothetical protein [Dictyoglomus thermophilum]